MYIRCAFFRGRVKPGQHENFTRFVRDQLVPLWTQFPGAEEVRVLRQAESDTQDPRFEMVLAIRYPSRAALESALASDARVRSREATQGLVEMFDGDIFHTLFDAAEHPLTPL
jgi:antibiotic biosynthesis monooxygenase (ABM) superfamily enzyme